MSCAERTGSPLMALPNPAPVRWPGGRVVTAIATIAAAFREALLLRRAAHRIAPFVDA